MSVDVLDDCVVCICGWAENDLEGAGEVMLLMVDLTEVLMFGLIAELVQLKVLMMVGLKVLVVGRNMLIDKQKILMVVG